MNSRQRLLTTLNHKEPDRVPYDFGAASTSGIKLEAYKNLLRYLGRNDLGAPDLIDRKYQTVLIDYEIAKLARSDAIGLYPHYSADWQTSIEQTNEGTFLIDEWGIKYKRLNDGTYVNVEGPLRSVWPTEEFGQINWPQPRDKRRLDRVKVSINNLSAKNADLLKVMNFFTQGLFELSTWLIGYEEFLTSLIREPKKACGLLDRLLELKKIFWSWVFQEVNGSIDVVKQNDDLGEKQKPIISPDLYRKYLKPRHKELHNHIKSQSSDEVFILFHSDGAILELIEDFIETGIDILNPIQLSAKDMDPKTLKERFGDRLVFWGGGIDVTNELPQFNPQEVKGVVKKRMEILAPNGGFVFAPTQSIQTDVPPENIVAMWDAIEDFGEY